MNKYLTIKDFCDIMDRASRISLIKSFRSVDRDGVEKGLHIEDLMAQYMSGLDAMNSLVESYLEFIHNKQQEESDQENA